VQDVLKTKLAYYDELSILSEKGLIYDPDLEDNLDKKLEALGVGDASFIIVKDDGDDDTPRVDVQFAVEAEKNDRESTGPAVRLVLKEGETLEVPRRPKRKVAGLLENGVNGYDDGKKVAGNGATAAAVSTGKRKRDADEDLTEGTPVKKLHLSKQSGDKETEVVVVGDEDGAIVLD